MRAFASAAQGGRVARVEGSNVHLFGGTQWHCFVVADPAQRVCGYYALTAGAVAHQLGSSAIRRNMPDPVQVLARLAVARHAQGEKLGVALLQDAVNRAMVVAQNTGVRALLVHALHERARQFYKHYGFQASPVNAMVLMVRIRA